MPIAVVGMAAFTAMGHGAELGPKAALTCSNGPLPPLRLLGPPSQQWTTAAVEPGAARIAMGHRRRREAVGRPNRNGPPLTPWGLGPPALQVGLRWATAAGVKPGAARTVQWATAAVAPWAVPREPQ